MTEASTPPLAPKPANPLALPVQHSVGIGAGASIPEVEHTASGVFEVSLEGLGASVQDIKALRRIWALIMGKAAAAQQKQEARPSLSQAQPSQQQGATPTNVAPDAVDFNIRQAEWNLALLQSQFAGTLPQQQVIPTPAAPTPAAAGQAVPASQQHVWNTLQDMQAQLDQWRQQKDASEGQSINHRQKREQAPEHFMPDDALFGNIVPISPLSVELESTPWPHRFNANTLPQYDGDYNPKEFLMKFQAAVESNGGNATTKAKLLVMALKGEVQYWYANIPKGHITSWFQQRNKLFFSFKGTQVEELDSNDLVNMCIQRDIESLQEYMHRVVKLTAHALGVSESSTIDAIVGGLRVGNCQYVLDRSKSKSLQELFEVMQEYCKSDMGLLQRLDRANAAKKKKQQSQWDSPKGWQNHPPKQAHRQVNNVFAPSNQNQSINGSGTKDRIRMGGDRSLRNNLHHPKGGERFFCWLHGVNAYHHTHHCPSATKKKTEWQAEEKAKAAGLAANHVMKCQNLGQFRALPPPYHHQSLLPASPMQVLQPTQAYTPSAPQLAPPPPMHTQQPSVFVSSWPNPPIHHQTPYN
jgi:hypothetical protein